MWASLYWFIWRVRDLLDIGAKLYFPLPYLIAFIANWAWSCENMDKYNNHHQHIDING